MQCLLRDRFRDRECEALDHNDKLAIDELLLFRKDVGTFLRQYDFLSQIVNYEDPAIEKLSIYLRHLAPVISSEQLHHEIDLSTVDFDYLAHHKGDTTSGKLTGDVPLQPAKAVAHWKEYAAETDSAVLLVTHTNRLESQDIRNTYGLSGALRQVARSTIYALEDPDTKALLVGPDKSNLGAKSVAHRFIKTPVEHFIPTKNSDGTVALPVSIGDDTKSIHDMLAEQVDAAKPALKTSAIDLWLRETLSDGPRPSADLEAMADVEGYSTDQLRGARKRLNVTPLKVGNQWLASL